MEFTRRVNDTEMKYRDVYQAVRTLDQTYQSCKGNFPPKRYSELKAMIKICVADEVIEKAKMYSTLGAVGGTVEEKDTSVGFAEAAEQLKSGIDDHTAARKDFVKLQINQGNIVGMFLLDLQKTFDTVLKLHKAQLAKNNEERKKRKAKGRFLRLSNRLEKLKRDYEESKQHFPLRRYTLLKEMIKPLIRDEDLKIDG